MGQIAYKLVRLRKDGSLGPLFVNCRLRMPIGEWMEAESHPTKGFAYRPGFHCCRIQHAPHLSEKGRVWIKCEVEDFTMYDRPESQGSAWILAQRMKVLEILQ